MDLSVQSFWLPKLGNDVEEYEDAFACSLTERRLAIADGATESSFAEIWAQSLVKQYTLAPPVIDAKQQVKFPEWLSPLQAEWRGAIKWDRLPWFAEEKARKGAFATFVGVEFFAQETAAKSAPVPRRLTFWQKLFGAPPPPPVVEQPLRWRSIAVGDSCVFQIRGDALVQAFPLTKSEEFNSRPTLLSSNPSSNQPVWSTVRVLEGEYRAGDQFILVTDALGKWFLAQCEAGEKPWHTLQAIKTESAFRELVADLRKQGAIRNDDTTLLISSWHNPVNAS